MTDRNPTLEAMVEEMARAIEDELSLTVWDDAEAGAYAEIGNYTEAAQACASIAQKEIEALTAERDALREENAALREKLILKIVPADPIVFEDDSAALNERPAQ